MRFKKLITSTVMVCLLVTTIGILPFGSMPAEAQIIEGAEFIFHILKFGDELFTMCKDGGEIFKFFMKKDPTEWEKEEFKEIKEQLAQIEAMLQQIEKELRVQYDDLMHAIAMVGTLDHINDIIQTNKDFNLLAGMNHGDVTSDMIDNMVKEIIGGDGNKMRDNISSINGAICGYGNFSKSALYYLTQTAIESFSENSPAYDFSAKVESTNGVGIIAERPMYFMYKDAYDGGHCKGGETSAATEWYFAEGTCRPGFEPYICIQNPQAEGAEVRITYMKGDGTTDTRTLSMAPNSRSTIAVKGHLGEGNDAAHDFSAKVESTNGMEIIAERPMYFMYRDAYDGGHCEGGVTTPATEWYFAEGTCRPGFEPYICIQNPQAEGAEVRITYMKGDGTTDTQEIVVPGNSRSTQAVRDFLASNNLMDVYTGYLENEFLGLYTYQLQAARLECEAESHYHPFGDDGQQYMNQEFIPMIVEECDAFLAAVEKLVMSGTSMSLPTDGGPFTLTDGAQKVLARADFVCQQIMATSQLSAASGVVSASARPYQGYALFGRVLADHMAVPQGSTPPALTARSQANGTKYDPVWTGKTRDILWLQPGNAEQPRYYDHWSGNAVNTDDVWSVAEYAFDVKDTGVYDILDGEGRVLTSAEVATCIGKNPDNPDETVKANFGDFVVRLRGGGAGPIWKLPLQEESKLSEPKSSDRGGAEASWDFGAKKLHVNAYNEYTYVFLHTYKGQETITLGEFTYQGETTDSAFLAFSLNIDARMTVAGIYEQYSGDTGYDYEISLVDSADQKNPVVIRSTGRYLGKNDDNKFTTSDVGRRKITLTKGHSYKIVVMADAWASSDSSPSHTVHCETTLDLGVRDLQIQFQ